MRAPACSSRVSQFEVCPVTDCTHIPSAWREAREGDMPGGPEGQKRSADVVGNAIKIMGITTGEEK